MPTFETRYLDTASSGGDGTTPALSGANAAYATWEAARADIVSDHANMVTDDIHITVEMVGTTATPDTTAITNTWPTQDSTRHIVWKAVKRTVRWDPDVYTFDRTTNGAVALSVGTAYMRIIGVQVYNHPASGTNCHGLEITANGTLICDGVKFRGATRATSAAVWCSGRSGRFVFRNCLSWGFTDAYIFGSPTPIPASTEIDIYNCDAIGTSSGAGEAFWVAFAAGGSGKILRTKNNNATQIIHNITVSNHNTHDSATNYHNTNLGGGYVDATNGDFSLTVADTVRRDLGTDLSGVADFPFTEDANGNPRPFNVLWDIGMHEFGSGLESGYAFFF